MNRLCRYPGCKILLSGFVPSEVVLCGDHQVQLAKLAETLKPEALPEKDIKFVFYHKKGCRARQLCKHLGIPEPTMSHYLHVGRVKAQKTGTNHYFWKIAPEEITRVVIIFRNWVSITRVAREMKLSEDTLMSYAKQGYFGSVQPNLSDSLCIHRNCMPGLERRFAAIRQLKEKKRHWHGKHLSLGEVSPREIASRLQTSLETVYYWMRQGRFPFCRRGTRVIVEETAFRNFASLAVANKISVKKKFLPALKAVCEPQPA